MKELGLEAERLRVHSIEHGPVGVGHAALVGVLDHLRAQGGFLVLVAEEREHRLLAAAALGEQRLPEPALVMRDDLPRDGEHRRDRAVVALEPDDLRAGKAVLKGQDIPDLGAAKSIYRLIVVADDAYVSIGSGDRL